MMTLLLLKSRIQNFYEKHYKLLNSFFIIMVVSAIIAYIYNLIQISYALVFGIFSFFLIYALLYGRFEKKQYFVMLAYPLLAYVKLEFSVPIIVALFFGPAYLPAIIAGIIFRYMTLGAAEYTASVAYVNAQEGLERDLNTFRYILDGIGVKKEFWIALIACILAFLITYFIRKSKINNSFNIAILVGILSLLTVELISNIILNLEMDLLDILLKVLFSTILSYIINFFHLTLDFRGMKKIQFEDDEYYYYVTAIPKFKVTVADRTVTRILTEEEEENMNLQDELDKSLESE